MAFPSVVVGPLFRLGLLALLLNPLVPTPAAQQPSKPLDVRVGSVGETAGSAAGRKLLLVEGEPFIPVGVSYHFTYHRDSWDDDLQAMRDLGLNSVRIDLSWRDVVPLLPGHYRFGFLDEFLDRASKHGLYVVPVFSHTTRDFNTPLWYWPRFLEWISRDQEGRMALDDLPSINYPGYRQQLRSYIDATVRHIEGHPAVLAYQVLNEPRYDPRRLYDYNPYSIAAFRQWLQQKYGPVDRLNKSWFTSYISFEEVEPIREPAYGEEDDPLVRQWSDWRQFGYDNLADFTGELARAIKAADPGHPVIVAEMAWWWWGEQPYSGVSPLHIYRDADIVGYDLYPDSMEDASYFLLTSDMLSRYWQKPVWVMELNRKDGDPTGEETQRFVSQALEGGASGIFYFQWRDDWRDGGSYGVLDEKDRRKPQYGALAATVRWLRGKEESLVKAPSPRPDLYLVWPSAEVGHVAGDDSPAWEIYLTARRIVEGGLRLSLVAEELIQVVDPAKLLTLRDGRLHTEKGQPDVPRLRSGGPMMWDQ
ncbi:MAG: beta-galactosidase [Chloroflexota bacterium]